MAAGQQLRVGIAQRRDIGHALGLPCNLLTLYGGQADIIQRLPAPMPRQPAHRSQRLVDCGN